MSLHKYAFRVAKRLPSAFLLAIVVVLQAVYFVSAQEGSKRQPTDDEVNAVAKQLYCPVCENIPLDVCGTQACAEWRELIRLKLAEGWNEDQIKKYFADQYGDRVLAAPPPRGLNWLAYLVPPVLVLAGVYILIRIFRGWTRPSPQVSVPAAPEDMQGKSNEYLARLEEELKKL